MNVIKKIYLGFFSLLLVVLIFGVFSIYTASEAIKNAENLSLASKQRGAANNMKFAVVQVQGWLTDISATRGAEGFDDGYAEAEDWSKVFFKKSDELKILFAGTKWVGKLGAMDDSFAGFYDFGKKMAQVYIDAGPADGNEMMKDFDPIAEAMTASLDEIVGATNTIMAKEFEKLKAADEKNRQVSTILAVAGILLGLVLAYIIANGIKVILSGIIEQISVGSSEIESASGQLSDSSQSLAEGATEQAASLEQTSSSLEEISSQTKQNADNALNANALMQESQNAVATGTSEMGEMTTAMDSIKDSSGEISKIIKVIEEIAFQTNLLALNAAVEAARAGEHGKGFAVVAEEVRNLAQRSATASKDTASLIENAVSKASEGSDIVAKVAESLSEIEHGIKKAGDLVAEISTASSEQAEGVDQVSQAVSQMDKVVQSNAATSEEAAASTEELSSQTQNLNGVVESLSNLVFGR